MGGYGFIRINLFVFPTLSQLLTPFFLVFALITIIYAGVVALAQTDIKRMIALTSVNHMGVVLLGVYTMTSLSIAGAVWQMFNHALAIGMLFLLSGIILDYAGTREIPELKGLLERAPRMAWFLFFAALAGMSLPGLSPFISEFMVFIAAFQVTPFTVVAVIGPILVSAYFLWVVHRTVFSESPTNPTTSIKDIPRFEVAVLMLLVIPLVVFGIYPDLLLQFITPTVENLISIIGG
jgi:NADH-quinone oxidoreductase subunit M